MIRCFIALWPPDAVRAAIERTAARIVPVGCRRVRARNLHLTVHFLGSLPADRLSTVQDIVARTPMEPFTLELGETGSFPKARVAWLAPLATPPALAGLHARLRDALQDAGFELESRAFRPHVTLARPCREMPPPWPGPPVPWRVDHAVLCRSDGTDDGVRYTVVARSAVASVR